MSYLFPFGNHSNWFGFFFFFLHRNVTSLRNVLPKKKRKKSSSQLWLFIWKIVNCTFRFTICNFCHQSTLLRLCTVVSDSLMLFWSNAIFPKTSRMPKFYPPKKNKKLAAGFNLSESNGKRFSVFWSLSCPTLLWIDSRLLLWRGYPSPHKTYWEITWFCQKKSSVALIFLRKNWNIRTVYKICATIESKTLARFR